MHNAFSGCLELQALKTGKLRPQVLQPHEPSRRLGLTTLVLDEADLILSMPGYDKDLQELAPKVSSFPCLPNPPPSFPSSPALFIVCDLLRQDPPATL